MVPYGTMQKAQNLAGNTVPVATTPVAIGTGPNGEAMNRSGNISTRASADVGHESRSESLATRFTRSEVKVLSKAAASAGKTVRAWSRDVLLLEARRAQEDMLFTELIATRMILLNLLKPLAMGQQVTSEDFARISTTVRNDKRKVAQEIQQQYMPAAPKEV